MPLQNDPAELSHFAIELAHDAGDILKAFSQHGRTIDLKSSNVDMVTDADKATEKFLVDTIRSRRPDDGILGEEGTQIDSKSGITWIIDPLDGTTNFVYSFPMYSVSVGAVLDEQPIVGAVYNPMLDEMFSAYIGGGAFLNGEPKHVNVIHSLETALIATGFSYSSEMRGNQANVTATLMPNIRDIRRAGSAALDLCNVAVGRVDAYFEHSVKPWDITAGTVIATEAGARVTGLDGGAPTKDVLAAPPALYDLLLPYL